MQWSKATLLVVVGATMSGCASILSGTSETVSFDSNPPGASCDLMRDGKVIGSVKTPGGLVVKKTKDDIHVTCKEDGYQDSTGFLKSGIEGETWGNIILGGGIGWAVDSAAGADNEYPDHITITMVPATGASATLSGDTGSAPPPPIWHTVNDNVQAFTSTGWVSIPSSISMALIQQRADQGLFRYANQNGSTGEGWIVMTNVRQQP